MEHFEQTNIRNAWLMVVFLGVTFLVCYFAYTMPIDVTKFHHVLRRWSGTTTSYPTQHRHHNLTISGVSILSNRTAGRKMNCTDDFRNRHLMTVDCNGRTGNQMFQVASLLGVTELMCYTPVRTQSHRLLDDIFDLQNVRKVQNKRPFKIVKDIGFGKYDSNLISKITPNSNWTLRGFRQSYKYFQNYSEYVRSSFRFKPNITRDVIAYLRQKAFHDRPKVCMHVRRGDFLNLGNHGFSVASLKYINASVTYMAKHLKTSNFSLIVASDDKAWCKQNIRMKGSDVFISPFTDLGRDLCLMTQCDHNIITTGSFSWMGAWLNETGVVVYYKLYPTPKTSLDKQTRHEDYYPSHWIGL